MQCAVLTAKLAVGARSVDKERVNYLSEFGITKNNLIL